jgi:ferrochelatase
VIDLPAWLRFMLVNFFIIPFRTRTSTHAYQSIWTDQGSPLLMHTRALAQALEARLNQHSVIEIGMRYGEPSIAKALQNFKEKNCQELIIFPLYPQYASASTGSALEEVMRCLQQENIIPSVRWIRDYFNHPAYIAALATRISQTLQQHPHLVEYVLFSYHGIPERQLPKKDCHPGCDRALSCPTEYINPQSCYRAQCYETTRLAAELMELPTDQYSTSFQSRLGKTPWIKPYTDEILTDLAARGIKNISIVCPSFTADCLETLEEIGIRARQDWIAKGGNSLLLIPCLNTDPAWVDAIVDIVNL